MLAHLDVLRRIANWARRRFDFLARTWDVEDWQQEAAIGALRAIREPDAADLRRRIWRRGTYACADAVRQILGRSGNRARLSIAVPHTFAGDLAVDQEQPEMTHDEIEARLAILTEQEREVVRLYYWGGLSLSQIGARLGVTKQGVAYVLNRAEARIRGGSEP